MALHVLAGWGTDEGAIGQLFTVWNAMVPGLFDGSTAVDKKVRDNIMVFVSTYIQVRTLVTVVERADAVISDFRDWSEVLVCHIKQQHQMMPLQEKDVLTTCVELDDLRNGKTWLASIHDTLSGNPQSAFVQNNFRSAVIWGSRGINAAGLRHVMALPHDTTSKQIVAELNNRAGRIMSNHKPEEAIWWQGKHYRIGAAEQSDFSYRVFPPLPPEEFSALIAANTEYEKQHGITPCYLQSNSAFIGQRILSVECVRP
ncbi:MAG: hypothetical protein RLZZ297_1977, partial [Chloroflexota bacterium]